MTVRQIQEMPFFKLLPAVLISLTLLCCSSPLEREYNPATMEKDLRAISAADKPDSAETALLAVYLTIGDVDKKNLTGKTYAEILRQAMEYQLAREAREARRHQMAEQTRKEMEAQQAKMRKALNVKLMGKGFTTVDWQEYLTFRFAFTNQSARGIRAFKATVVFTDLFDEEIYSLAITCDEQIPAGDTLRWETRANYNPYTNKDVQLKSKRFRDLKIKWQPQKIIYTDNSTR